MRFLEIDPVPLAAAEGERGEFCAAAVVEDNVVEEDTGVAAFTPEPASDAVVAVPFMMLYYVGGRCATAMTVLAGSGVLAMGGEGEGRDCCWCSRRRRVGV